MAQPNMRSMRKKDFERQVFKIAHDVGTYYHTSREDESTPQKMAEKWGGSWLQIIDKGLIGAGGKFTLGQADIGVSNWIVPYHTHTQSAHNHYTSIPTWGMEATSGGRAISSGSTAGTARNVYTNSPAPAIQYAGSASDTLVNQNYHPIKAYYIYERLS